MFLLETFIHLLPINLGLAITAVTLHDSKCVSLSWIRFSSKTLLELNSVMVASKVYSQTFYTKITEFGSLVRILIYHNWGEFGLILLQILKRSKEEQWETLAFINYYFHLWVWIANFYKIFISVIYIYS